MANQDNWGLYYEKSSVRGPRETLLEALKLFPEDYKGIAFDIGSGACNDVKHLLDLDWQVIATDKEPKVEKYFNDALQDRTNGEFQLASFEEIQWQNADIIHAGFALAFCPKEYIHLVLEAIQSSLNPGGIFSGNFFGPEHTWSELCLLSKEDILEAFGEFKILKIEESKANKKSTFDEEIFHHNITLIARKEK